MKRAFQILKRDMRRLAHNPIAMIVVAGVCLLPSLYAWFNIAANMDPYGNTGAVQIAVANLDKGTENEGCRRGEIRQVLCCDRDSGRFQ